MWYREMGLGAAGGGWSILFAMRGGRSVIGVRSGCGVIEVVDWFEAG